MIFLKQFSEVVMFADHTTVLISKNNYNFTHMFNSALSDISKWFQTNQLITNVEKTYNKIHSH